MKTRTSPAVVFVAVVLGLLAVVAILAVVWRVGATPGVTGDIHVVPVFGRSG